MLGHKANLTKFHKFFISFINLTSNHTVKLS